MRLLGIDLETTGLDTANDLATELGYCLWENGPVLMGGGLMSSPAILEKARQPETAAMMLKTCHLTADMLVEFGQDPKVAYERLEKICELYRPDYIVAHNGENYDKPLLLAELDRHGIAAPALRSLSWLDTRYDIPFAVEPDSRKLKHLALDAGFINPFPHRALFDVLTTLKILADHKIEDVIEYSKVPWVVVRALVSYDDRQLAKDARYSWEQIGTEKYPKCWVKKIKETKLEEEKKNGKFQVVQI